MQVYQDMTDAIRSLRLEQHETILSSLKSLLILPPEVLKLIAFEKLYSLSVFLNGR